MAAASALTSSTSQPKSCNEILFSSCSGRIFHFLMPADHTKKPNDIIKLALICKAWKEKTNDWKQFFCILSNFKAAPQLTIVGTVHTMWDEQTYGYSSPVTIVTSKNGGKKIVFRMEGCPKQVDDLFKATISTTVATTQICFLTIFDPAQPNRLVLGYLTPNIEIGVTSKRSIKEEDLMKLFPVVK